MICQLCGSDETSVVDSRHNEDETVRRRRICKKCGTRFTTFEITMDEYFTLRKIEELAIKMKEVIDNDWETV